MNHTVRTESHENDEISLVDLAVTLVRRRRSFYVVFGVVSLLGIVYSVITHGKYEYTSLIQLAETHSEELAPPAAVIATLQARWIPDLQAEFRKRNGSNLPFEIKVSNPVETSLIRFVSEGGQDQATLIEEQHQILIEAVRQLQAAVIQRERERLSGLIDAIDNSIHQIPKAPEASAVLAAAIERRTGVEGKMLALRSAEVLAVGRAGVKDISINRAVVVVFFVLLGVVFGILAVLFLEFGAKVRNTLRGTLNES